MGVFEGQGLLTPGGISWPLYIKDSEGEMRGDRKITPGKHRIASFTTPFYVKGSQL